MWCNLNGLQRHASTKLCATRRAVVQYLLTARSLQAERMPALPSCQPTVRGEPGSITVGGHRGAGINLLMNGSLSPSYRENTLKSFERAVDLGCSFVEFDVQVSRDAVPVLWHDDSIITGDAASPTVCEVSDLSLAEFQGLITQKRPGSSKEVTTSLLRELVYPDGHKAYVPWLCDEEDILPTLEDLFERLPESVGFDVEVKMTLGPTIAQTPPEEVDRVITPILEVVQQHSASNRRDIVFSSFDPDVCIELRRRQSRFPVYFLSGCGLYPHVDFRRTSIPAALQVASSNDLAGIVVPAVILHAQPQMVAEAAARGLTVMTYGLENSDLQNIQQQCKLGVRGAIVDDAAKVIRGVPVF